MPWLHYDVAVCEEYVRRAAPGGAQAAGQVQLGRLFSNMRAYGPQMAPYERGTRCRRAQRDGWNGCWMRESHVVPPCGWEGLTRESCGGCARVER
ncbi:hypothetical protein HMPREF1868_01148 [Olsenella sp. DNF00959]|nr:hypothetical protein HMPREF1868_01148 [Olsenella sp. DNF00959]